MRPWLLRPAFLLCFSTSAAYGRPLCRSALTTLTIARRPAEVGLTLTIAIFLLPGREVDFLARLEAHVSLLPVLAATDAATETLDLALDVGDVHGIDFNLEQQLDSRLDLRLGRRGMNLEHDLPVTIGEQSRLLRDLRREQHLHQTLLAESAHCQTSSILASAPLVTSTLAKLTSETGSVSETSSTSTLCRLRDDRNRFSSN